MAPLSGSTQIATPFLYFEALAAARIGHGRGVRLLQQKVVEECILPP